MTSQPKEWVVRAQLGYITVASFAPTTHFLAALSSFACNHDRRLWSIDFAICQKALPRFSVLDDSEKITVPATRKHSGKGTRHLGTTKSFCLFPGMRAAHFIFRSRLSVGLTAGKPALWTLLPHRCFPASCRPTTDQPQILLHSKQIGGDLHRLHLQRPQPLPLRHDYH